VFGDAAAAVGSFRDNRFDDLSLAQHLVHASRVSAAALGLIAWGRSLHGGSPNGACIGARHERILAVMKSAETATFM
jgi:hypothetical protein